MSCNEPDRATMSLPVFAQRGAWCRDGWGIGYFCDTRGIVEKSADAAVTGNSLDQMFYEVVHAARSRTIVAHVRYATSCSSRKDSCNSHPFMIRFHGRDWLFAHNGTIRNIEENDYPSRVNPPSDIDSARAFSFIMDRLEEYVDRADLRGIYPGIKRGLKRLKEEYGGKMNILLTDGDNLYVFNDGEHQQMYYLWRSKQYGQAYLVTTIENLSDEPWRPLPRDRLIVVNRGDVLIASGPLWPRARP
ncbi:MAG: class II glutamine amidotransferase [Candidatus Thorarchaeota archaeon]